MTAVKICGLIKIDDINNVNRSLPDYAGFVFAPGKRQVNPEAAGMLSDLLNPIIKRVGVFVNDKADKIIEAVSRCRLNIIQLHGDEEVAYLHELREMLALMTGNKIKRKCRGNVINSVEIWKAIRIKGEDSIEIMDEFGADAYLLDSYVEGSYGGAGRICDWAIAAKAAINHRIILAGGLNCENVADAIGQVRPYAVDVSSGVETEGGKDGEKIDQFIRIVRGIK